MIIWSGWGILVPMIAAVSLAFVYIVLGAVIQDEAYLRKQDWPMTLALVAAGVAVWWVGTRFEQRQGRVLVDKETGQEVRLNPNHSLFFIPMKYWGPVLGVLGIVALFADG